MAFSQCEWWMFQQFQARVNPELWRGLSLVIFFFVPVCSILQSDTDSWAVGFRIVCQVDPDHLTLGLWNQTWFLGLGPIRSSWIGNELLCGLCVVWIVQVFFRIHSVSLPLIEWEHWLSLTQVCGDMFCFLLLCGLGLGIWHWFSFPLSDRSLAETRLMRDFVGYPWPAVVKIWCSLVFEALLAFSCLCRRTDSSVGGLTGSN